tara:strand:+ start:254 stop:469 length:216 start_codon:yes stop_codon:yes gene_type:complete
MNFDNKKHVVDTIVKEFKMQESSFYNSPTNKSRNKFWTFNRCVRYYYKLEKDFIVDEDGNLERVKLNGKKY